MQELVNLSIQTIVRRRGMITLETGELTLPPLQYNRLTGATGEERAYQIVAAMDTGNLIQIPAR